MSRAIVTSATDSQHLAGCELAGLACVESATQIAPGLTEVVLNSDFAEFASTVAARKPIFVRHVAPADVRIDGTPTPDVLARLSESAAQEAASHERPGPFAVQVRFADQASVCTPSDAAAVVAETVAQATGRKVDQRAPSLVVSILWRDGYALAGVSTPRQNRSIWSGGQAHYRVDADSISRSEMKLIEAVETFRLSLPVKGAAVDLGAAPGGWTRLLRSRGMRVVAVDPAELHPLIAADSGVRHIKRKVEDYIARAPVCRVMVNDLRMDAGDSVAIMLRALTRIEPGGLAVVTLKYPETAFRGTKVLFAIHACLDRLQTAYRVLDCRQLFHNRSEVTAVMIRPRPVADQARDSG